MYKSYKAATGRFDRDDNIEHVLRGINERHETIVSVTSVGVDNFWALIITEVNTATKGPVYRPVVRHRSNYIDSETSYDDGDLDDGD